MKEICIHCGITKSKDSHKQRCMGRGNHEYKPMSYHKCEACGKPFEPLFQGNTRCNNRQCMMKSK